MKKMNIYLCGVGGQGIGLLAEALSHACLKAGYNIRGSDTHGLAQRHGTVVSHLRIGDELFAPQIPPGKADLIIGLERLETLRAICSMLNRGGTVVYYDAVYQPIQVRTGQERYPDCEQLEKAVDARQGRMERVFLDDLANPQMQNMALLGRIASIGAVPGVTSGILTEAIEGVVPAALLTPNLEVFNKAGS